MKLTGLDGHLAAMALREMLRNLPADLSREMLEHARQLQEEVNRFDTEVCLHHLSEVVIIAGRELNPRTVIRRYNVKAEKWVEGEIWLIEHYDAKRGKKVLELCHAVRGTFPEPLQEGDKIEIVGIKEKNGS